ncbi:MAG: phenylalanine--tRNA ligase subunit alpha [Candidatus Thorarchaeota archaeon]|nr:MAG: phenylalanine--tRNA ligase subunit alpha [Candidatus Thorarchaeota archaeon]
MRRAIQPCTAVEELLRTMSSEIQLTEGERRVLSELIKMDSRVTADDLAERLGERKDRIVSILNALAERGIVDLGTIETDWFELTDEGKEYAQNGLPEVRLFNAVKDLGGEAELGQAVRHAGIGPRAKGIAISWCKKNGWISITKRDGRTILSLKTERAESPAAEVLSILASGAETVPDSLREGLEQVIDRTLVTFKTQKTFVAEIPSAKRESVTSLLSREMHGLLELTPELLATGGWRNKTFRPFNVEIQPAYANLGKKHPYAEFLDWLKEILVGLGFTEWFGPYVETEFWNNDVLFVPQDHVAREVQDQFRVAKPYDHGNIIDEKHYRAVKAVHENGGNTGSLGWQAPFSREITTRLVLRSHTTPVSMRYLWAHDEPPQKMFIIDRNFRAEKLSAKHAQEFNQCEGIIWDKDLTLRDLMGYISEICRRVGIKKMKFKPGQFPFTEPSVEGYAKHETLGWIEVAPGGIFRPEVTYPLGIKDTVLAWGLGAGRMYMAAMDIADIRELYSRDLTWLRRKYFVR